MKSVLSHIETSGKIMPHFRRRPDHCPIWLEIPSSPVSKKEWEIIYGPPQSLNVLNKNLNTLTKNNIEKLCLTLDIPNYKKSTKTKLIKSIIHEKINCLLLDKPIWSINLPLSDT